MIVTRIEPVDKTKFKIYIDDEYQFILYQKDIYMYDLEEGKEITDLEHQTVLVDTVIRRGKQKALALLKFMDRTESELVLKLQQAGYAAPIIDLIINYVKGYRYIDDLRYAINYVKSRKESKSKTVLKMELKQKGVPSEYIDQAFEEEYKEGIDEEIAILKHISKKVKDLNNITEEEKVKVSSFLYRKGFSYDTIKKYLNYR